MELQPTNAREIKNPQLQSITRQIARAANTIRNNTYKIARLMYEVNSQRLYTQDGFRDTVEYGAVMFKLKKSSVYNLIRIGEEYTDDGKQSNIPHDGADFGQSQVVAMLPISHDHAVELAEAGTLTPDLSVRQIQAIVKAANEPIDVEADEVEEVEPLEDEPEPMSDTVLTYVDGEYILNGEYSYQIPEIIAFLQDLQ